MDETGTTLKTSERRTRNIQDNGFCPQWKDKDYFSVRVHNPDVAMVEFVVKDKDKAVDELMCKCAVPVSSLRQGIRSVQFYDRSGQQHGPFGFARILVDVAIVSEAE